MLTKSSKFQRLSPYNRKVLGIKVKELGNFTTRNQYLEGELGKTWSQHGQNMATRGDI